MRAMIWVKSAQFEGWACSECDWIFNPTGPPVGDSLDEMTREFERQRDKDFASHLCARHPRTEGVKPRAGSSKDKPRIPRRSEDQT